MTSSSPNSGGETHSPPPSGLVVPIVIWGKKPPDNRMTSVRVMSDRSTIITGSDSGHVIVWRLDVDSVSPNLLFFGHSASISAITPTSLSTTSTRFISTSEDGQVCLWDWLDGRCIDNVAGLYVHRQIQPYNYRTSPHSLHTRLICAGDYSDFVVLDPQDLNVLFTISSRVEPDWISSFSLIKRSTKADQCVGLSAAGMIKIWTLTEFDKKDQGTPLYEEESKRLEVHDVKAVSFSPSNEKILLVVTSNMWQIIDLDDLSTVVAFDTEVPAIGGHVLEIDKIAIAHVDSTFRIYQLPLQLLTGPQVREQFGSSPQNHFQTESPFEIAVLEGNRSETMTLQWTNTVSFHVTNQKEDTGAWQVVRASVDGNLLIWHIPRFGKTFLERITAPSQLPLKYKGTFSESLDGVWKSLNDEKDPLPVLDSSEITTSLYVGSQGKLVIGRASGTIVMTYACDTLSRQLLTVPSDRPTARALHGHTGAVRALMYPHEHSSRFDMQILLSGADDFSVIVWNINTAVRLFRFCVHGGPVTRFLVPPSNTSKQTQKCVAAIGDDNTIALLNVRDMKCMLLASRHPHRVTEIKWRPLDDYMLVRLDDGSVYVWQIETANIDRIVSGLQAEDILAACDEQIGLAEGTDEAGANQAVQFMRALKHRNIDAVKRVGGTTSSGTSTPTGGAPPSGTGMASVTPLGIQPLPGCNTGAHVIMFEVASLIHGLTSVDMVEETSPDPRSLSQLMNKQGPDSQDAMQGLSRRLTWQFESNLYLDVARLLLSLLHAWELDADLDTVCTKKLGLHKPKCQLFFGNLSRQGHMAVVLPTRMRRTFESFAVDVRWQASHSLTTIHLLGVIATSNTLMSMRNSSLQLNRRKSVAQPLMRRPSKDSMSSDRQQLKQGWSLLAALHCVLLPDHVRPKTTYAAPRIELLARRWQDGCLEIREAAQALLIRELNRLGSNGRKRLIESWAPFLPTLLDPTLSIFGPRAPSHPHAPPQSMLVASQLPPPIPPRSSKQPLPPVAVPEPTCGEEGDNGVQQVRRNQATSIILLGVVGAEFGEELNKAELTRATAISLLELLVSPPSALLPVHSPLRRAAIDLLGRGFVQWEPHLEISKVLLGLLDLAANTDRHSMSPGACGQLSPIADACRTARHALSLIANARPPALLTALSMEVARYNSAAQHQTIQHTVVSPLLKSRAEVLRIIEELSDKKFGDVVDMMLPVGDVLVHCLDTSLLKHKTLAEVFPPITKFYMVAYCSSTRRIAFGGRNGTCIVHELRSAKAQNLQAHQGPVTAVAFSEDGKYLATYGAHDAKINFWQASQSFLGMGQSQIRCVKTQPAPSLPTAVTPGGQSYRPRLVWINAKSLTLMLPEGREQRFTV